MRDIEASIGLAWRAALLAATVYSGISGGEVRPVNAADNTPTSSPTATRTPNATATALAEGWLTVTAVAQQKADEAEAARIRNQLSILLGTPTATSTPGPLVQM